MLMSAGFKAFPEKAAKQLRVHDHAAKRNASVCFARTENI